MTYLTDIVGYTATVVGTFLMVPQAVKSWRTRRVDDVSTGTVFLYFGNCLLWLAYGILIHAIPIAIANAIGLLISIAQIYLKIRYTKSVPPTHH